MTFAAARTNAVVSLPLAREDDSMLKIMARGAGARAGSQRGGALLRGQQGFTLLEMLIAITLMAIGVLAVLGMQTVAMNSNSIANQLTVGSSLCQEVLEDVLSWDSTNAVFSSGAQYDYAGFPGGSKTFTDGTLGSYTAQYTTTVGTAANGIPVGDTGIAVTVTYHYRGTTKQVTMSGLKRTV
jgi:type IV pilus assembly protein PilV